MLSRRILLVIAVLLISTLACSVSVDFDKDELKVGKTVTEEIRVERLTGGETANVSLEFGAGELKVEPGSLDALVEGVATYNVSEHKPKITISGSDVTIRTGDLEFKGIPRFEGEYKNQWELKLGSDPMRLSIQGGAYRGEMELGGLYLEYLRVADGAADVELKFSQPNLTEMELLRYDTGASSVELIGLANANFAEMSFKGGAGSYVLDFSGELKRNATVSVDAGLSNVRILVPEGVSARVLVDRGLANVDIDSGWEKSGNDYTHEGVGPRLTINVNIGAGNLELRSR